MTDPNDFPGRIVKRLGRMMTTIEGNEYTAADEVKILHDIIRCLADLNKFRDKQDDNAGAEIRKYADSFPTEATDGARGRQDNAGRNDRAGILRQLYPKPKKDRLGRSDAGDSAADSDGD